MQVNRPEQPVSSGATPVSGGSQSEELYRLLAENSTDMISRHDMDGAYLYASPACRSLLGYEPDDLVGRSAYEFFHPEDFQAIRASHSEIIKRPDVSIVSYRIRRADGSYTWFETTSKTIRDPKTGEAREIIAVSRDITERKRVEEELRESRERTTNILESITDAFFALDREWRFTYLNREAENFLLRSREDLIGKNLWEEFPEAAGLAFYKEYHRALKLNRTLQFQEYYPPLETWFEVKVYPSEEGVSVYFRDVGERKLAESRLQEAERRFHSAFDNTPIGMAIVGLDGRYVQVNRALCGILGYSEREMRSATFHDLTHPEDRERSMEQVRRISSGEVREYSLEKRYLHADGHPVWTALSVSLVTDDDDQPLYYISQVQDITERRRTEDALRKSEREYRNLFELANDAILIYEPHSRSILDVNESACRMYGLSKQEFIGKTVKEVSHDRTRTIKYLEVLLRDGSYKNFETVHRRSDGALLDVVVNSSVIDFRGRRAVLSVNHDVSNRKKTEAKLREAEARYRSLVEHIPAVTYIREAGEPSRTIYISPQIEDVEGYTPGEILEDPEHWARTLHPDDRERVLAEDVRTNESGEPFDIEYRQFAKDGRVVWVRDEAVLVRDPVDRPLYWQGILVDITGQKRLDESLSEIQESERRRIARDLHDAVLQDMAGALQGMQAARIEAKGSGQKVSLDQEIDALRRAVSRLRNAIFDLRTESRQPFVQAVEALMELNRQMAPQRTLDLVVQDGFPEDLPDTLDMELLRILQEALVNTRRHSGAHGVRTSLLIQEDILRAEVTDDGRGFDPRSLKEGVGISGMRERASALGGKLEITSQPRRGTTVTVEIPL